MDNPLNTVGSAVKKWKLHCTIQALPRQASFIKLIGVRREEGHRYSKGAAQFSGYNWSEGVPVNDFRSSAYNWPVWEAGKKPLSRNIVCQKYRVIQIQCGIIFLWPDNNYISILLDVFI